MGTHPNCPSVVASTGASLQSWIEAHPESLGQPVRRRFGTQLPFLFKVSGGWGEAEENVKAMKKLQ